GGGGQCGGRLGDQRGGPGGGGGGGGGRRWWAGAPHHRRGDGGGDGRSGDDPAPAEPGPVVGGQRADRPPDPSGHQDGGVRHPRQLPRRGAHRRAVGRPRHGHRHLLGHHRRARPEIGRAHV